MGFFDFLRPLVLGEAEIRVVADGRTLRVKFILKTFRLAKQNDYAAVSIPGLNGGPLQFLRGHTRTLEMVLYFDGRTTNTDVRQSMQEVTRLMSIDPARHAPPVLSFEWTGFVLKCVLESSTVQAFSSLFPDGRPSRGQMHVIFREFKTVAELVNEVS